MRADTTLLRDLHAIVGAAHVFDDPDLTERYRSDWTKRYIAPTALVVRPGSTAEVAAVVGVCADRGVAVVPQGGNTGLVGGSVPLSGELLLSTERLVEIEHVTAHAGTLTAAAGATLAQVQDAARAIGWDYGVDIGSRDSATVGGTIATNACGTRVLRHGDTRRQVIGVEFVTGAGEIVAELGGTLRDNTGYHLPSIVTGSEGTLGVVTRARLRLIPQFRHRTTALLRFPNERDAVDAAEALRGLLPAIESAELFFGQGLELVCGAFGLTPPFAQTAGGYVLAEVADNDDPTAELAEAVAALGGVADVAVAQDAAARDRLWRYRERHTEAIATVGVPHKLDVALPPGALADFVQLVPARVAAASPGARTWLFGHGGEGSVHVNVTGAAAADTALDAAVLQLVANLGGSISAEHGIGRAKLASIELARDQVQLRVLARMKAAFDPVGIMNPAVLLPRPR